MPLRLVALDLDGSKDGNWNIKELESAPQTSNAAEEHKQAQLRRRDMLLWLSQPSSFASAMRSEPHTHASATTRERNVGARSVAA